MQSPPFLTGVIKPRHCPAPGDSRRHLAAAMVIRSERNRETVKRKCSGLSVDNAIDGPRVPLTHEDFATLKAKRC